MQKWNWSLTCCENINYYPCVLYFNCFGLRWIQNSFENPSNDDFSLARKGKGNKTKRVETSRIDLFVLFCLFFGGPNTCLWAQQFLFSDCQFYTGHSLSLRRKIHFLNQFLSSKMEFSSVSRTIIGMELVRAWFHLRIV